MPAVTVVGDTSPLLAADCTGGGGRGSPGASTELRSVPTSEGGGGGSSPLNAEEMRGGGGGGVVPLSRRAGGGTGMHDEMKAVAWLTPGGGVKGVVRLKFTASGGRSGAGGGGGGGGVPFASEPGRDGGGGGGGGPD